MNNDPCQLLNLIIKKTQEGKILWFLHRTRGDEIAIGLDGVIKYHCSKSRYMLFYYLDKKPDCYLINRHSPNFALGKELHDLIIEKSTIAGGYFEQ